MARNEEKHFCNLNRIILLKEKEEYEKAHPSRPTLNLLHTPEEIQQWLPSIKKDIDFYLKKSQVTCYSDEHVEECKAKIVKLEKEFKAFVRKIKQLTPSPLDVIPWTSRPYKRRKSNIPEENSFKEFKHIVTPILDNEKNNPLFISRQNALENVGLDYSLMNQPLRFCSVSTKDEKDLKNVDLESCNHNTEISPIKSRYRDDSVGTRTAKIEENVFIGSDHSKKIKRNDLVQRIVNYDSSDCDSS